MNDGNTHTPLWIHPVSRRRDSNQEEKSKNGSYRVIQKLVTSSPNPRLPDAEIETALEAFITPSGDCLWRRVAVWSGPCSPQRVIHASFVLPDQGNSSTQNDIGQTSMDDPLKQPALLCWAAFPERPNHKLLCVLINPSTLSIWDVYPDSDKVYVSGEGHSVSLPFQCCAVHPLGENHGLLLQRKEDQEDLTARTDSWALSSPHGNEEDEGFFLKVPPRNMRMGEDGTVLSQSSACGQLPSPRNGLPPAEVSSLFSLKHPLEDVLPISHWSHNEPMPSLVTDVFERVLYSGTLLWTDHSDEYYNKKVYEQPICVTYHSMLKR
jgi:hypothetical protein